MKNNNNKLKMAGIIAFSAACGAFAFQGAKDFRTEIKFAAIEKLPDVAKDVVDNASLSLIGSRGAAQVSQVIDESRIQIDYIIVRQNQEMIRLLKKIAGEK